MPTLLELGPHPRAEDVHAPPLDWAQTPLAQDYPGAYVKIIDDVFTPAECAALIALAESDDGAGGGRWAQAAVHYGLGENQNYVNTDYRNSERILRFDADAAEKLTARLLPYVPELLELSELTPWASVIGRAGVAGTWRLVGLNERLSFLRYGPGHYFRGHCDGQIELPDGRKSRVSVQIYLEDAGLEGGATRITGNRGRFLDVFPKKGRVLIFQQRDVWHSGEDVTKGLKYTLRTDFMFRQTFEEP